MHRTSSNPSSPEAVPTYVRVNPEQPGGGPPEAGGPSAGSPAPRVPRSNPFGPNREWVPFAIGAAVLLICAVLVFASSQVYSKFIEAAGPTRTATRSALSALATATTVPTVVRLPTTAPATATAQLVLAKVVEKTVNVRAEPNKTAKVISSLKSGNQISLVGRNAAGDWYQINITNNPQPGWVFGETLQIVSGDPKLLPVAGTVAPTATKAASAPGPVGPATPTIIGARPPGQ